MKTAVLSLLVVVGLVALWDIYEVDTPTSLALYLRRLHAEYVRRQELPRSPASVPLKQAEQQAPPEESSSGLAEPTLPKTENSSEDDNKATNGNSPGAMARGKSSETSRPTEPPVARRKTIEGEIGRAIQQRAVEGVIVSFVNDTAYLTGAVLSENQKTAAEQAARNVPGVKRVRSSISVRWANG